MIIKALTIENFKGIREPVRVEFKPITLLFGPNSAGKSTIVQALHYTTEVLERHNLDVDVTQHGGEHIDLGGFRNILFEHDENRSLRLIYEIEITYFDELKEYIDVDYDIHDNIDLEAISCYVSSSKIKNISVSILITWSSFFNKPYVAEYEVGINGDHLARVKASSDGKRIYVSNINFGHQLFALDEKEFGEDVQDSTLLRLYYILMKNGVYDPVNEVEIYLKGQQDALPPFGVPLNFSKDNFKDHAKNNSVLVFNAVMSQLIVGSGEALRDTLRAFKYLGPMREIPSRNYEAPRYDDHSRWSTGLAAWDVLYKADDGFIQNTNSWLTSENKLNSGYRIDVRKYKELDTASSIWVSLTSPELLFDDEEAIEQIKGLPEKKRLFLRDETNGIEVLPQDVGIGISQVLPVIVVALHSNSGIVAIEQPELHIHPAFQIALGDLFISQVKEQDVCFLLETHSEHLLLRLLRRIRETQENELPVDAPSLSPDKLSIHYIEQTEKGMSITPLQVDETGEFVNKWPRGFFEERDEELF